MTAAVSEDFMAAAKRRHKRRLRVTSLSPLLVPQDDISSLVLDGSSNYSHQRLIRSTCNFVVANKLGTITPLRVDSIYFLFSLFKVELGIDLSGGTEWCPMGVFSIAPDQESLEGRGSTIQIAGEDRFTLSTESEWTTPQVFVSTNRLVDTIRFVAQDAGLGLDDVLYALGNSPTTLGATLVADLKDKRADFMSSLAYNHVQWLYMNDNGQLTLHAATDPTTATPVDVWERGPLNMLARSNRSLSKAFWFNHTVVIGEDHNGYPVRGEARDENPLSISYYQTIGDRVKPPRFSAFVTNREQAYQAALQDLWASALVVETLRGQVLPNPALRPGDSVHAIDTVHDLNDVYFLDTLTIPWKRGMMSVEGRKVRSLAA